MGGIYGCDCEELYRFPHITYPYSLLLYLLFFAAASLLFVQLKKIFFVLLYLLFFAAASLLFVQLKKSFFVLCSNCNPLEQLDVCKSTRLLYSLEIEGCGLWD